MQGGDHRTWTDAAQAPGELDAILAAIALPIDLATSEGVITYANQAAVDALGFDDASELIGQNGHWLVHYKRPDGSPFPIEECPLNGEAIERLERTGLRPELARAHLLYGEWLRRDGRRRDVREELRTAHQKFAETGMEAFAARARRELLATGETVRKRGAETRDDLTAQEEQLARLARGGLSNPQIGSQLFISPRTVEWHLRKVFSKLGIRTRNELRVALPDVVLEKVPA